jgi:hypothetical protein
MSEEGVPNGVRRCADGARQEGERQTGLSC